MKTQQPPLLKGLALYTVRDAMADDPRETLARIAQIGYNSIEAAGYEDGRFYGMPPAEFKSLLDSLGIEPLSTHLSSITLDNADTLIAHSLEAGFEYLVIPIPPMGHFIPGTDSTGMAMSEDVEAVAKIIDEIGMKGKEAGIQVLYHNHDFEFRPNARGLIPMDYFIEHTDPEAVKFELDLYWVTRAGKSPGEYFEKAPGRFVAWHVKDMDAEGRFAPVGTGSIDFGEIVALREASGMKCYFVEQDQTFGKDVFAEITTSFNNLDDLGL